MSTQREHASPAANDEPRPGETAEPGLPRRQRRILYILFAASGASALVYQVLWVRAFADVFGATAEAAAAILAAFFLGLALGSDLGGRIADRIARPLRMYAWLELGIAVAALPALAALLLYRVFYDQLYSALSGLPALFSVAKVLLTALALLPATALMGGTLPALGRALVRDRGPLGEQGGRLYASNIVGAVGGAVLAAFGLPLWLGTRGAYVLAIAVNLLIALVAGLLARGEPALSPAAQSAEPEVALETSAHSKRLLAIAFGSGFGTIALELLWTRLLALVLQNSVYSFGSVVAVFLAGLAGGAALMSLLIKRFSAWRVLRVSLLTTALLITLTPAILLALTGGLKPFEGHGDWLSYSASTVALVAAVILLPVIAAGMTLPGVWELWRGSPGSGTRLGRPTALNTLGAIFGPIVAGFVGLPLLGMGGSLVAVAVLYLLMGELVVPRSIRPRYGGWERALVYSGLLLVLFLLRPIDLPAARIEPSEQLLWSAEGARGAVAVVERGDDRRIKLDNHYAIGGSQVVVEERRQGHLPLLLHPEPRSVAFIGMGTGITAGAALAHSRVERVVAMELVPEIIAAAREYFRPWNAGVVDDPRAVVVTEDGRVHLAGTAERFDVIVGDLFLPWREGAGALYAREHFETVQARLRPGGIFAQWLPLWQLSRREFDIIANTFSTVFDHVSLWRGVFNPTGASIALVAHEGGRVVDLAALERRLEELRRRESFEDGFLSELTGFMVLYAGDLSGQGERLAATGLNTNNRPRIEWLAPRTLQAVLEGRASWLTGSELADLYDAINRSRGPADRLFRGGPDPLIYRQAGAYFYRAEVVAAAGDAEAARALRTRAFRLLAPTRATGR